MSYNTHVNTQQGVLHGSGTLGREALDGEQNSSPGIEAGGNM